MSIIYLKVLSKIYIKKKSKVLGNRHGCQWDVANLAWQYLPGWNFCSTPWVGKEQNYAVVKRTLEEHASFLLRKMELHELVAFVKGTHFDFTVRLQYFHLLWLIALLLYECFYTLVFVSHGFRVVSQLVHKSPEGCSPDKKWQIQKYNVLRTLLISKPKSFSSSPSDRCDLQLTDRSFEYLMKSKRSKWLTWLRKRRVGQKGARSTSSDIRPVEPHSEVHRFLIILFLKCRLKLHLPILFLCI